MTEKLLTGTLSLNTTNQPKPTQVIYNNVSDWLFPGEQSNPMIPGDTLEYSISPRAPVNIRKIIHQNISLINGFTTFSIILKICIRWIREHDKTNKMSCAPSEDSDPPNLIRIFAMRCTGSQGPKVSSCGQRRL